MANKNKYGLSKDFYKPKAYQPKELADKFLAYTDKRQDDPFNKKEAIKSGDRAGEIIDIPQQMPLTIRSFCVFAGITRQTFLNYESKDAYKEYFEVTTHIRDIIEADQIDGATVGAYNPNIIARLMGLAEKSEIKQTNIKPPGIEFTDPEKEA